MIITKPIVLVGIMGSGKTFFGKKLSKQLNLDFFDLDIMLRAKTQYSTKEIFQNFGAKMLEKTENEIIEEIFMNHKTFILSTNDTVINNNFAWTFLKKNALVIWLNIDLQIIAKRLKPNQNRPHLDINENALKNLQTLYQLRKKRYYQAHIILKKAFLKEEFLIKKIETMEAMIAQHASKFQEKEPHQTF